MEGSEEQREGGLIGREEGSGREIIKVEISICVKHIKRAT